MLEIIKDTTALLGSLSVLATALAHLPLIPAAARAFFARIGVATSKFSVEAKETP